MLHVFINFGRFAIWGLDSTDAGRSFFGTVFGVIPSLHANTMPGIARAF